MERPLESIIKLEENSESTGQSTGQSVNGKRWKCDVCGDEFRAGYDHCPERKILKVILEWNHT